MKQKTVTVGVELDTRKAALLVQTASKFQSKIQLAMDDKLINGKSIMGTVSLGITKGQTVDILADGPDEADALEELSLILA